MPVAPSYSEKVQAASICIKSNGNPIDMSAIKDIAVDNNIQVVGTHIKDNGDMFIKVPSKVNQEKLLPLLTSTCAEASKVVPIESKLPSISILNVEDFTNKDEFIVKMKKQNPDIEALLEAGSVFKIVFSKKLNMTENEKQHYQLVVRVSEDIRKVIKQMGNWIYYNLTALRVVDRFYIKRCNKCQHFGHYQKDCTNQIHCGLCNSTDHTSTECPKKEMEKKDYACVNCQRNKKEFKGHSAHWHKCPTYIELQSKLKKSIPYYRVSALTFS